ncbi:hemocyte protein-glutamine gamma-glutamyltransferase-like [Penaeus japonicus]|uniref:hemocyte protein-glutamine gamma-glutamyltransferase-like n=1 Tax=Penaeus japonicus TaxID=27405 RepID=UPI001C71218A|nr:hemocyte protein-glutamine gamma-glutamyltransferase-like [Penaeus japonicus]
MPTVNPYNELINRFTNDLEVCRREDRDLEIENELNEITRAFSASKEPKIVCVDFQPRLNAAYHHCDRYELVDRRTDCVVLRRGGMFSMVVELNQQVNLSAEQQLKLYFSFGPRPNVEKGTQAHLLVSGKTTIEKTHDDWDVKVAKENGKQATIEVQIPTDAPVGVWSVAAEVSRRNQPEAERHLRRFDTHVYILFNPWNENDGTYLPEELMRQEYVLEDVGKVFVGSYPHTRGRHWAFGQFDDAVLPACMLLLERSGVKAEARGDPVRVSRALSKMVNSNDDSGLLVGKWDGEYEDGRAPAKWIGSIEIMETYLRTRQSVKYGQCWVFAACLNTICRALGMPCRVVTNFASAHDTNISLSIDEYFDEDGDKIEENDRYADPAGIRDSIWNFHVWNDVWMSRPDLPDGFGGWQVIDATPQETSDGSYQCGPASHEAIKQGRVDLKYDVPFVLAEVNADVVRWRKDDSVEGGFAKMTTQTSSVGRLILTKKAGPVATGGFFKSDREDITWEYKPPEGTRAERVSILTAARRTRTARQVFDMPSEAKEDIVFSIEDRDQVPIGDNFTVMLTTKNTSTEVRTINVVMTCASMYYTGAKAHTIKRHDGEIHLEPNQTKTMSMEVYYSDYYSKLVDHDLIKSIVICNVNETTQCWAGEDNLEVHKPDIQIDILSAAVVKKPVPIKISFDNPIPLMLTNCVLILDAPGVMRPKRVPIKNIAPKGKMTFEMNLNPGRVINTTLVVQFNSKQLHNLTGAKKVVVSPA